VGFSLRRTLNRFEKAIRPAIQVAAPLAIRAFAPGAAPIVNAFLNPAARAPQAMEGYFPDSEKTIMALRPLMDWYDGLTTRAGRLGAQVAPMVERYAEQRHLEAFGPDDEEEEDEEEE
jgi:hypothetical protein